MIIAQISDFHLKGSRRLAYGVVDTAGALEACVAHVNALDPAPDVILATGDLTDMGRAEDYAALREILAPLKAPLFAIPGNHDVRDAFRTAFADAAYIPTNGEWIQYTVEDYPVRLVALDTVVPGAGQGALCDERIHWLDQRLGEQPERPTIVFMHHPPVRIGIHHMDMQMLCQGADALGAVIARHGQVQRILCGHVHRPSQTLWNGTMVSTAPSPSHQVALDLRHDGPSAFVMEPPACQIHVWYPDQGLVSHISFIGRFDGPYPFYENGKLID